MPRKKKEPEIIEVDDGQIIRRDKPILDPVAREKQMVGLAVDLAEKQLRDGTASSSVITHYLKIGSTREYLEREILEKQSRMLSAKAESIESGQRSEELYTEAIDAMRRYSGVNEE